MSFKRDLKKLKTRNISVLQLNIRKLRSLNNWFSGCAYLETVKFGGCFDITMIEDVSAMFKGCENLRYVNLDALNFTSCTDFSYMFQNCNRLEEVKIYTLGNEQLLTMERMFFECHHLKQVILKGKIKDKKYKVIGNKEGIFWHCIYLKDETKLMTQFEW